jgi:hypothetical protein
MKSISQTWGTVAAERELSFPCDGVIPNPAETLFRGITINAPAGIVFRWLCQMRVAPYSYDWLDNGGRSSPPNLSPGLDQLAEGQTMMQIFKLVSFARDEHMTIQMKPRSPSSKLFGDIVVSYTIRPQSKRSCRLVVKIVGNYPTGLWGRLMSVVLPWGDLVMMRRQLLNFKALAEDSATR